MYAACLRFHCFSRLYVQILTVPNVHCCVISYTVTFIIYDVLLATIRTDGSLSFVDTVIRPDQTPIFKNTYLS